MRTGGVEPPQPGAPRLHRGELAGAQRPHEGVAGRARTGAARITTSNAAATPRPPRTGTAGLEPAASRLTSERSARLSYAPDCAGGSRTRFLELMRLARSPFLHRARSGRQDSNLRCPASDAGGLPLPHGQRCFESGGWDSNPQASGSEPDRFAGFRHRPVRRGHVDRRTKRSGGGPCFPQPEAERC